MTASIGSILSVARTALSAHQAAIGVISHNLANATTEGYSRQRAELVPGTPLQTPVGGIGTGVRVDDIGRVRDTVLDAGFRNETSGASYWSRRSGLLGEVQSLHGGTEGGGLPAAMDAFWNAWSDLSNDPAGTTTRVVVRQTGQQVIEQIRRLTNGLDAVAGGTALRVGQEVEDINRMARDIAALNTQIVAAEAGGITAADLRDRRDQTIDRLSQIVSVQVVERANGSVGLNIAGISIVDGPAAVGVRIDTTAGTWRMQSVRGAVISPAGGSVGAAIDVLNNDIPGARTELDTFARALVDTVNTTHRTGMNAAGATDINFFDDNGDVSTVTAASLRLSAVITADAAAIAAGSPATDGGGLPVFGAGRNDVALALAGLRNTPVAALGNRSLADTYTASVSRFGGEVRAAEDAAETHGVLASQADVRRSSVSGVSTDEELVQLIRFQNAYSAAARVVTAADEMLQTILDMKR